MESIYGNGPFSGLSLFQIEIVLSPVCSIDQEVVVSAHVFNMEKSCISTVTLEIDFFSKKNATSTDEYNSDLMAAEFTSKFANIGLRCETNDRNP